MSLYRQTLTTTTGDVTVGRESEDSPILLEFDGHTLWLTVDEASTVVASLGAACIIHRFPEAARQLANPENHPETGE